MSTEAALRVVDYVCVSTEEQGRGYSLPTQVAACREFAEAQGYVVVEEFREMCSGEELDRPQLNELFDYVSQAACGGVKVIVVYDVDRLARRAGPPRHPPTEVGVGVRIEYVRGDYNSDSPRPCFRGLSARLSPGTKTCSARSGCCVGE